MKYFSKEMIWSNFNSN